MTEQNFTTDQLSPAMVAAYFTNQTKKKNNIILMMSEEIVRLNQELERQRMRANHLERFMSSHGGHEVWEADQAAQKTRADMERIKKKTQEELDHLEQRKKKIAAEIPSLENEHISITLNLEDFAHPAMSYSDLNVQLRKVRASMKSFAASGSAVKKGGKEFPDTPAKAKQLKNNIARLALRCFNAEAENIIKSVTAKNVHASADKIGRAADAIARLTKPLDISINYSYQELKGKELELAGQVEQAREIEKEKRRELREAMKEQAKVDAELEAKRRQLQKERKHFENVLQKMEALGDAERIAQIQAELEQIDAGIADVDYRKANIRAGYVYVISNIGSFGERMIKIGMTRRLDPMDRVKELGDASVPFGFDVHALFFTEDAVDVEHRLHEAFAQKRVNRINKRREFFYATPAEVHEVLEDISGDILEFVEEPEAEQYYASLQIAATE